MQNVLKACKRVYTVKDAYHNKVPHPSSFSHQCGDTTAARHQDNLDGLGVQKVIEQLGGFSWITLKGHMRKCLTDGQMNSSICGLITRKRNDKMNEVT